MSYSNQTDSLNLTIANRVHILEPQWNPMSEKQAIGRVVRLGQMKGVIVHRYVMRDTIEEVRYPCESIIFLRIGN